MTHLLVYLARLEISLAIHLETLGAFWAQRALDRATAGSGKNSGTARRDAK